jgi:tetratricopeptide (TPR) repeat protein
VPPANPHPAPADTRPVGSRLPAGWPVALIIVATLATYSRAPFNGYIWDDRDHVYQNNAVQSPTGLWRIWFEPRATPQYYPLVFTSFWLEHRLWGLHPMGYHVTNVLLHAANAVLVWLLLRRLKLPGAWLAATLFAVHPVHVETVAWITERKNTLSAFFYLFSALLYLRFAPLDTPTPHHARRGSTYAWSLAAYAAAMLSKTVTCSLPAALLLLTWWKRRLTRHDVLPLLPFFALGLALGLTTIWVERNQIGARGPDWDFTLPERFLIAGRAVWFYAAKLVWPADLAFIYPRWQLDTAALWQWAFPAAAAALLATLWALRRVTGNGPLAAMLFFGGTLFPALGFINVYPMLFSFVADHFQYLASLGIICLLVGAAATGLQRLHPRAVPVGTAAGLVTVLVLGILSWQQVRIYAGPETLWRDTLTKNPNSWMVNFNLAQHLHETDRFDEARPYYEAALRTRPGHDGTLSNLAAEYAERGQLQRAIALLERGVTTNPDNAYLHRNLAVIHARAGNRDEAVRAATRALELAREQHKAELTAEIEQALGTLHTP